MRRKRTRGLVALLTLVVSASAVDGWAFWTASGVGTVALSTASFLPATLTTPASATNSVTVTWTDQASLVPSSASNDAITYVIERKPTGGSFTAITGGGCSGPKPYGTASCGDAPSVTGSYSYRVVATLATWTATSSESGPVALVVDATAPTVQSIARAVASPTNAMSVSWTVTFSEPVAGVGSGDFTLAATGPTGTSISTVTGSGTTYTVSAASGTGSGTLGLNLADDDSITDAGANRLGGAGAGNGNLTGQTYTIDKTAPTVSSINRVSATPTNLSSVSWTVILSETVTSVDSADFALATSGVTPTSITSVTGSGTTYTVTASTGSGDGTVGLNLVDDDTIIDAATNKLGATGTGNGNLTGQTYTIDKTAPTVTSISRVDASLTNATSVSWTVTFSEPVTGVSSADLTLAASGLTTTSITSVTGSGTTYTVTASTATGSGTLGLNVVDDDSIIDAVTNKLGGTGTANGNLTGQTYTIDKTPPTAPSAISATSGVVWNTTSCGVNAGTRYVNGTTTSAAASTVAMTANVTPETGLTIVFSATRGATSITSSPLAATTSPVTTTQNLSTLSDGTITLTAHTVDAAGNPSTTTTSTAVLIKDTVTPPLTASYSGGFLGLDPTVSGDSECGATVVTTKTFGGNTGATWQTTIASGTDYSIGVEGPLLGLGSVTYSSVSTDRAGNRSAAVVDS